ncbi:hypothetical protein F5888DRAFT_1637122 [Russula emetica]|nr:hypothetical protein F5888DRAFT_1637122 [Russula emetica]
MGWFSHDHEHAQAHNKYQDAPKHKSHVTHELFASAAAYEAAKAYEKHKEKNGQPVSHAKAKEIAAGFAGGYIDKEFETHGVDLIWCRLTKQLDFLDKKKAKHQGGY